MSITKNFEGFIERIDSSELFDRDEKEKFIEYLSKLEDFAIESEEKIFENSSYISTDLRKILEMFLDLFILRKAKKNYKEIDNSEYLNSTSEEKIKSLEKMGFLPKYIKNILFNIKTKVNDNIHYKKDKDESEATKFNKSSLVESLHNVYNLLYWYFEIKQSRKFSSNRYYLSKEKEPNVEFKVKEIFPDVISKNIVVNDQKILNILFDTTIKFIIPNYQRKYAWGDDEIDELFLDLDKSIKDNKNHFFGVVTLSNLETQVKSGKKIKIAKVIDGQQRFTTIILIIRALYNAYSNLLSGNKRVDENLTNFLTNKNIPIDRFDNENSKIVFDKIWSGKHKELSNPERYKIEGDYNDFISTNLFKAFSSITRRIKKYDEDQLDDLYSGLRNLVIGVNWIKDYDEFELFESINSKGLRLTNFDIFKSFILSLIDKNEENNFISYKEESTSITNLFEECISNKLTLFEKKDDEFEEITDKFFSSYVRYYSDYLEGKPNKNRIFTQFKFIFIKQLEEKFDGKSKNLNIYEFIQIIYNLAIYLNAFLLTESERKEIWKKNLALRDFYKYFYTFENTVFSPILISYFLKSKDIVHSEHGNIIELKNPEEFKKILKLIEAWRMRVLIARRHDNQINIIEMPRFIKKFNSKYKDYSYEYFYEILKEAINDEIGGKLEFPKDNTFLFALQEPIDNFDSIKKIMFKIIQQSVENFDIYEQEKYDVYSLIERTEKKRSEDTKEFLNLTEEKLSKLGNYFFHTKITKIKKKKEKSISFLDSLIDNNFTTNIENNFEILSVKDLKKYKDRDIEDYINPRSKSFATKIVDLFKSMDDI